MGLRSSGVVNLDGKLGWEEQRNHEAGRVCEDMCFETWLDYKGSDLIDGSRWVQPTACRLNASHLAAIVLKWQACATVLSFVWVRETWTQALVLVDPQVCIVGNIVPQCQKFE